MNVEKGGAYAVVIDVGGGYGRLEEFVGCWCRAGHSFDLLETMIQGCEFIIYEHFCSVNPAHREEMKSSLKDIITCISVVRFRRCVFL